MKILVINAGSSSLKYQFLESETGEVFAKGLAERIGITGSLLNHRRQGHDAVVRSVAMPTHKEAISAVLNMLTDANEGVIQSMDEIQAVGHRVVHGGEAFASSAEITEPVMRAIRDCIELAPLHNPPNLVGIEACCEAMPQVPQVAVFDTAFHQTMPPEAYMYAIPYSYYKNYGIRRYGFHGTSHAYVASQAASMLERPLESLKLITCHLGNGSSIAAVKNGVCIDTSMGLTPLAGVPMGTRCGDIDPAIIKFILEKETDMSLEQLDNVLNKQSGVAGISGVSSDFRDLTSAANEGHTRAQLALDMFSYHVRKYIGSYAAAMGGVDAIIFTAGVGENGVSEREDIVKGLEFLGLEIDPELNKEARGIMMDVSKQGSRAKVLVIPTNEELSIAKETANILSQR